MESPRLSAPVADGSTPPSPRSPLVIAAMLCAPLILGGLLLFSTRPSPPPTAPTQPGDISGMRPIGSSQDGAEKMPRIPDFPAGGPSPAGNVTLENVRFDPLTAPPFSGPFHTLSVRHVKKGELLLEVPAAKRTIWQGAVTRAFAEETVAGVRTVKKELPGGGDQVIWSDAAEKVPDLRLQKEKDGSSRLLDKRGATLWSGWLKPNTGKRSGSQKGDTHQIIADGVQIDGKEGAFTVRDASNGSLLWSGRLPTKPTLLLRNGHEFTFQSPHSGEMGTDYVKRVQFDEEIGTVTATDRNNKTVGTRPVTILKTFQTRETIGGGHRSHPVPVTYTTPNGTLKASGTIFLTYKDSNGQIIRRSKLYKNERGDGRLN